MTFIRKIKKKSGTYLAEVENYREDGKVKQRFIKYVGTEVEGIPQRRIRTSDIEITEVKEYLHFYAIDSIAKELDLHNILGSNYKLILLMVYSHLVEKLSINKMKDWIDKTDLPSMLDMSEIGSNALYEALDDLEELNFDSVNDEITKHWIDKLKGTKHSAVIVDVTDTYFSGSQANWKRRKGKDGKYDKLVQIGLAVSSMYGFPLKHKVYEGNIGDSRIMLDFISEVKMLGFEGIIMDRGMSSTDSIAEFNNLNISCIAGLRSNSKIEKLYLDQISRDQIYSKEYQVKLKDTIVYAKSFDFMNGKLIAVFNPEIEVAQRNKALLEDELSENKQNKIKYYGFSLIYHSTYFETSEVVAKYFEKDIVEKSFHQIKGVLSLHPLRVRMLERISAHVKICYLAFCILSLMNYKLKSINISAVDAIEDLSSAHKVCLKDSKNNWEWSKVVTLKKSQDRILKALGVKFCSV